jgi:1-acyl-sn-glycerol-3-phosphate acyltransferase
MVLYTIPVTYAIWFVGLFNKYANLKYHIAQSWVNPWLWAARAKMTFTKAVEYKNNESFVVISNHLSNIDSLILFKLLKIKWAFMAKKEVYKLPVFRTAAKSFNFIKVDRDNPNDRESINEQAKNLFKNGWSLMVYPQGTRVDKNEFREFKNGAFHIAQQNNVRILPVVIAGTGDIWPRGSKVYEKR